MQLANIKYLFPFSLVFLLSFCFQAWITRFVVGFFLWTENDMTVAKMGNGKLVFPETEKEIDFLKK